MRKILFKYGELPAYIVMLCLMLVACNGKQIDAPNALNMALVTADNAYRASHQAVLALKSLGKIKKEELPAIEAKFQIAYDGLALADTAFIAYLDVYKATGDTSGIEAVISGLNAAQGGVFAGLALCKDFFGSEEDYKATLILVQAGFRDSLLILNAMIKK